MFRSMNERKNESTKTRTNEKAVARRDGRIEERIEKHRKRRRKKQNEEKEEEERKNKKKKKKNKKKEEEKTDKANQNSAEEHEIT